MIYWGETCANLNQPQISARAPIRRAASSTPSRGRPSLMRCNHALALFRIEPTGEDLAVMNGFPFVHHPIDGEGQLLFDHLDADLSANPMGENLADLPLIINRKFAIIISNKKRQGNAPGYDLGIARGSRPRIV